MTTEHLRNTLHATPFLPFTIRMADGRIFFVSHPDFVWISPSSRIAFIHSPDDSYSIVDLLLMTELEVSSPTKARA
jgi:hypothetical protein